MHFPEEQLTTYLRVFNPEDRIDALLDEVAQTAIDSDVQDTVELYSLAHWLMEPDERRTDELEAVVLVEEVGLDVDEVAIVLDIDRSAVEAAVARAWAEVATADAATTADDAAAPTAGVEVPERTEAVPAADMAGLAPAADAPEPIVARAAGVRPVEDGTEPRRDRRSVRLPDRVVVLPAVVVVALVALAIAAFSDAGQERLAAQGLNPFAAIGALALLFGVGGLLVVLGRDDGG